MATIVLPVPWAWVNRAIVLCSARMAGERGEGFFLVRAEFQVDQVAELLGQEVVEGEDAGDPFEENGELFLNPLRVVVELAVGPAEDPPVLVDEAVLAQKVVFELFDGDGAAPGAR